MESYDNVASESESDRSNQSDTSLEQISLAKDTKGTGDVNVFKLNHI